MTTAQRYNLQKQAMRGNIRLSTNNNNFFCLSSCFDDPVDRAVIRKIELREQRNKYTDKNDNDDTVKAIADEVCRTVEEKIDHIFSGRK